MFGRQWGGLPQSCPSCGESLVDTSVPREYRAYQAMFTTAETTTLDGAEAWRCPSCGHVWVRDAPDREAGERLMRRAYREES